MGFSAFTIFVWNPILVLACSSDTAGDPKSGNLRCALMAYDRDLLSGRNAQNLTYRPY